MDAGRGPEDAANVPNWSAHGWRGAELTGSGVVMSLATARDGSALLLWSNVSGTTQRLSGRHFDPRTGWEATQDLFSGTGVGLAPEETLSFSLSMNASGQAVATWYEWDGALGTFWAQRFTPSEGWASPQVVQTLGDHLRPWEHQVVVAVGDDGTAFAVFDRRDSLDSIWTSRQAAGGAWTAPEVLDPGSYVLGAISVAASPSGSALAVWTDSSVPGMPAIGPPSGRAAHFDTTSGWTAAEWISDTPGVQLLAPMGDGSYVAIWQSAAGLYENQYDARTGWTAARLLEPGRDNISMSPSLAVNGKGAAVVAYSFFGAQAYVRLLLPGADWTAAEELAADGAYASCVIDDDGNVTAVWQPNGGSGPHVLARRRDGTGGWWSTPVELAPPESWAAFLPVVQAGGAGDVFAAWRSNNDIWTDRYLP